VSDDPAVQSLAHRRWYVDRLDSLSDHCGIDKLVFDERGGENVILSRPATSLDTTVVRFEQVASARSCATCLDQNEFTGDLLRGPQYVF